MTPRLPRLMFQRRIYFCIQFFSSCVPHRLHADQSQSRSRNAVFLAYVFRRVVCLHYSFHDCLSNFFFVEGALRFCRPWPAWPAKKSVFVGRSFYRLAHTVPYPAALTDTRQRRGMHLRKATRLHSASTMIAAARSSNIQS